MTTDADTRAALASNPPEAPARPNAGEAVAVGYLFELRYSDERWSGTMYAETLPKPEDVRNVRPLYLHPATAPSSRDGVVTDEMVDLALKEFRDARHIKNTDAMRAAILAALNTEGTRGEADQPLRMPHSGMTEPETLAFIERMSVEADKQKVGEGADHLRMLAFRDILQFQPDPTTGKDAFEQIAIHARSTIMETQKAIASLSALSPTAGEQG